MAKQYACRDMGATNCNFETTGKDENTLMRKVQEHMEKVHKEMGKFDDNVKAKVRSVMKEV